MQVLDWLMSPDQLRIGGGTVAGLAGTLAIQWLRTRLQEAKARGAEAATRRAEIQAHRDQLTDARDVREYLEGQVESLRAELAAARARVEELSKDHDRLRLRMEAELEAQRARLKTLETATAGLSRDYAADQRDIGVLLGHVDGLHAALQAVQDQCARALTGVPRLVVDPHKPESHGGG